MSSSRALTGPFTIRGRTAASRVVFGPHETNLAAGRSFSDALVGYYDRRARGGAGIVVTENASVHPFDHPYERAPLASSCAGGWAETVARCRPHGTVILAGLTHTGAQGSTAYTREVLWAPSAVADVSSRELPIEMNDAQIDAIVDGFAAGAACAARADVDGVELDAGPRGLLHQFLSQKTNLRGDVHGTDRLSFLRRVVDAVRHEIGENRILALRLSVEEVDASSIVCYLAADLDLLTVVRGGRMNPSAYRPDFHTEPGFNRDLCRSLAGSVPMVLQGSIVDPVMAQQAVSDGTADLVEMTRALIADPDLVLAVRHGRDPRPCIRCNQTCLVRDPRNPTVACIGRAGDDPDTRIEKYAGSTVVVGGGPAGLEAARVAALLGGTVTLYERDRAVGGLLRLLPHARPLTEWLEAQCRRLGVDIVTDTEIDPEQLPPEAVVATGGSSRPAAFPVGPGVQCLSAQSVVEGARVDPGPVLVSDVLGGPIAVGVLDALIAAGREVSVVTVDPTVGRHLTMTGDMVPANVRLAKAGVGVHVFSEIGRIDDTGATITDVHSGATTLLQCAAVVDCAPRLPTRHRWRCSPIGDALAPRTAAEAVREGYRAAMSLAEAPR